MCLWLSVFYENLETLPISEFSVEVWSCVNMNTTCRSNSNQGYIANPFKIFRHYQWIQDIYCSVIVYYTKKLSITPYPIIYNSYRYPILYQRKETVLRIIQITGSWNNYVLARRRFLIIYWNPISFIYFLGLWF